MIENRHVLKELDASLHSKMYLILPEKGENEMIKIKQQVVDTDDICERVLTDVFGEDCMFSVDEYDTLCTIIEKALACVSENPEKLGYFLKGEEDD